MKNSKESLRLEIRKIISEKFKSSIDRGYFQDLDLGKGTPSKSGLEADDKKKSDKSINPFKGSINNKVQFDELLKKITLKIKRENPSIVDSESFKKMNEEYKQHVMFFVETNKMPMRLEDFLKNTINPFFKKNQSLLKISDVKEFYGVK